MEIIKVVTGMLDENCYILKIDKECLVIDPGDDYPKIESAIGESKVVGVLVTHSHFDHIGVLRNVLSKKGVKLIKHGTITNGVEKIGDFEFEIIKTPGHSSDSLTYYFKDENCMFVGDFLFKESVGRWDLPTGSKEELDKSIEMIKEYPDDIKLYSGHGDDTTLGYEKENNEFFR